jgi:copper chaperone CopZ
MSFYARGVLVSVALAGLLIAVQPVQAEYLRIQLKVYGLDCELCARGVGFSVQRLDGVKSVDVSLKKGMLDIVLKRGNTFKMSALRKRIRENGFRPMETTVTAVGQYNGSRFEVLGSGESYEIGNTDSKPSNPVEITFDAPQSLN